MKVRFKDEIEKLDERERAQGAACDRVGLPRPFPARFPTSEKPNVKTIGAELENAFLDQIEAMRAEVETMSQFEDPNVQAILAEQMRAFNEEVPEDESTYEETFDSTKRYVPPGQAESQ